MIISKILSLKIQVRQSLYKQIVTNLKRRRLIELNAALPFYKHLYGVINNLKWKKHIFTKSEKTEIIKYAIIRSNKIFNIHKQKLIKLIKPKSVSTIKLKIIKKKINKKILKHKHLIYLNQYQSIKTIKTIKVHDIINYRRLQTIQKLITKNTAFTKTTPVTIKPRIIKSEIKKFYQFADGVYTSYWFGRLTNMFIVKGKKKTIIKQMHIAMLMLKYKYQTIPLLLLYEMLEKLKPVFLLRKYKIRRTQLVEYPYVAKNSQRYMKALQWLRRELEHDTRRGQSSEPLVNKIYNKFTAVRDNFKKHSLIKTRDIYNIHANMSQFNIRYNWKRSKKW